VAANSFARSARERVRHVIGLQLIRRKHRIHEDERDVVRSPDDDRLSAQLGNRRKALFTDDDIGCVVRSIDEVTIGAPPRTASMICVVEISPMSTEPAVSCAHWLRRSR